MDMAKELGLPQGPTQCLAEQKARAAQLEVLSSSSRGGQNSTVHCGNSNKKIFYKEKNLSSSSSIPTRSTPTASVIPDQWSLQWRRSEGKERRSDERLVWKREEDWWPSYGGGKWTGWGCPAERGGKGRWAGKCLTVLDKLRRFPILFQSLPDLNLIIVFTFFLTVQDEDP